jgi:hypothetical protein
MKRVWRGGGLTSLARDRPGAYYIKCQTHFFSSEERSRAPARIPKVVSSQKLFVGRMSVDLREKETNGTSRRDSWVEDSESFIASDRNLIRRIDWHLLPWICILYSLSLVDRYGSLEEWN